MGAVVRPALRFTIRLRTHHTGASAAGNDHLPYMAPPVSLEATTRMATQATSAANLLGDRSVECAMHEEGDMVRAKPGDVAHCHARRKSHASGEVGSSVGQS